jgi:hypothetical protein
MSAEDTILKLLAATTEGGLDDSQLKSALPPSVSDEQRINALNQLIAKSRIQILQRHQTGVPFFSFISEELSVKLRDLDP